VNYRVSFLRNHDNAESIKSLSRNKTGEYSRFIKISHEGWIVRVKGDKVFDIIFS
jgi:hypothetical protein